MRLPPDKVAELFEALTPDQVEIGAAFYFDGLDQTAIGERLRVNRRTVYRALEAFTAALTRLDIPLPARPVVETDSRHVRNIDPALMRQL